MMQEERDKANRIRVAQREAQAKARAADLQAQRSREDADCLLAILSLKKAMKQQHHQTPDTPPLTAASSGQCEAKVGGQAPSMDVSLVEVLSSVAAHKAAGSMGNAAAPGRHRRSASWVQKRASSLDGISAAVLAGALLAGPRAAHQKSSSHDSGLPGKLPGLDKQYSRLSSAAADNMADGGQLQARPAKSSVLTSCQTVPRQSIISAIQPTWHCTEDTTMHVLCEAPCHVRCAWVWKVYWQWPRTCAKRLICCIAFQGCATTCMACCCRTQCAGCPLSFELRRVYGQTLPSQT